MSKRLILGKEVEDDIKRTVAGADCWLDEDGLIFKAKKLRDTGDRFRFWRAEEETT